MTVKARTLAISVAAFLSAALAPACAFAADGAPAALKAAVADVKAREAASADARIAFTRTLERKDAAPIVLHYTPDAASGDGWTLVSPPEDTLDAEGAKFVKSFRGDDLPDKEIRIQHADDLESAGFKLARETPDEWIYAGPAAVLADDADGEDAHFMENLTAEVSVSKADARLTAMHMFATAPFKPAAFAKIRTIDIRLEFAEAWPGGPLVNAVSTQHIAGSAMFTKFDEESRVENSDFTRVGAQ